MKKSRSGSGDEMRKEYDFRGGVRGKYAEGYAKGCNVVLLEPDVAARFKTPKAVNKALREYLASKERKKRGASK
jgi:hypothetical protein